MQQEIARGYRQTTNSGRAEVMLQELIKDMLCKLLETRETILATDIVKAEINDIATNPITNQFFHICSLFRPLK